MISGQNGGSEHSSRKNAGTIMAEPSASAVVLARTQDAPCDHRSCLQATIRRHAQRHEAEASDGCVNDGALDARQPARLLRGVAHVEGQQLRATTRSTRRGPVEHSATGVARATINARRGPTQRTSCSRADGSAPAERVSLRSSRITVANNSVDLELTDTAERARTMLDDAGRQELRSRFAAGDVGAKRRRLSADAPGSPAVVHASGEATAGASSPSTIEERAPAFSAWQRGRDFAIVVDAGSSGSRVQVYSWQQVRPRRRVRLV